MPHSLQSSYLPQNRRFVLILLLSLPSAFYGQNKPDAPGQLPGDLPESAWLVPSPPLFAPLPGQTGAVPQQVSGPIRISGGVMAAQVLTKVNPVYPPEARARHLEGSIVLAAKIGPDGLVQDLNIVSGPAELSAPAVDAVRQWTYKPYVLNGNRVAVLTTVTVNFKLSDPAQPQ